MGQRTIYSYTAVSIPSCNQGASLPAWLLELMHCVQASKRTGPRIQSLVQGLKPIEEHQAVQSEGSQIEQKWPWGSLPSGGQCFHGEFLLNIVVGQNCTVLVAGCRSGQAALLLKM